MPPLRHDRAAWTPWIPWILLTALVCILTVVKAERQTVLPVYHAGTERFFAGQTMHEEGIFGFLYLPAFSVLFGPFHALGAPVGDVVWRIVGIALLAAAMHRLSHRLAPGRGAKAFLFAGVLALAGTYSAARNGQCNLWIGALMIHAALDLASGRRTRAAVVLALSLAVKPIAIVPILLFSALDLRVAWRVAVGLLLVFALPFLFGDAAYVWEQHVRFAEKMVRANAPPKPYTEAFGGLWLLGWNAPQALRQIVRLAVALLALGLSLRAWKRHGREHGALTALGLAAAYLMAFNPVTEANGYVILAAVAAPFAGAALALGKRREGLVLAAGCFALGTHLPGGPLHTLTKRWFKPLLAILFGIWISRRSPAPASGESSATHPRSGHRPAEG